MTEDTNWSLIVPFLNDDPTYAYGVEFGLVYARLRRRPPVFKNYLSRANQDQVLLLASRFGYEVVEMETWDEHWFWVKLRRRESTQQTRIGFS